MTARNFLSDTAKFTTIAAGDLPLPIDATNVSYTAGYTGGSALTLQAMQDANFVTPQMFGALANGSNNDTAAIQKAINTTKTVFFPAGTYKVTDALTCATTGQLLFGAGDNASIISVDSASFNMSATGVFVFSSGEPGAILRDIQIAFVQPNTSTRSSLNAYPPAIYAQACPRFIVEHVSIYRGMTGIDMRGNSGGAMINWIKSSCFIKTIDIDESQDTIHITNCKVWPFYLTANQETIFESTAGTIATVSTSASSSSATNTLKFTAGTIPATVYNGCTVTNNTHPGSMPNNFVTITGIATAAGVTTVTISQNLASTVSSGDAIIFSGPTCGISCAGSDDVKIIGCEFSCARGVKAFIGSAGRSPSGQIVGCDFDSGFGLEISTGIFAISGTMFAPLFSSAFAIVMSPSISPVGDPRVAISGSYFGGGVAIDRIQCFGGYLNISGCKFDNSAYDCRCILIQCAGEGDGGDSGIVTISSTHFSRDAGPAYTLATVDQVTGRLVMTGCSANSLSSGSGFFVKFATNDYSICEYNSAPNWSITSVVGGTSLVGNNAI